MIYFTVALGDVYSKLHTISMAVIRAVGLKMDFVQATTAGFRNYVTFSGRASRSEFWYWVLFTVVVSIALSILELAIFPGNTWGPLSSVWSLITLLPSISVNVRRLHDIDRTGWWVLIAFTLIGIILLIVWACFRGTSGPNRYGLDPLGGFTPP